MLVPFIIQQNRLRLSKYELNQGCSASSILIQKNVMFDCSKALFRSLTIVAAYSVLPTLAQQNLIETNKDGTTVCRV